MPAPAPVARPSVLAYLESTEAAYVRSFRAHVVALPPGGAVLDRTFFYPEGGGQPADTGEITTGDGGSVPVVGALRSGPQVLHRLGRPGPRMAPLRIGSEITGTVAWPRRYAHMRAHTAQHLLSALLFRRSGRRTRSARLSAAAGTVQLEPEGSALPEPEEIAAEFGSWVERSVPVSVRFVARSEFDREPGGRSGLRPLPASVDPVRIVEIAGVDRCPCGGTHLRSTSEIGPVTVQYGARDPTGGTRVAFVLGPDPATPTRSG